MVGLTSVEAPYSMFVLKSSQWAISYLPQRGLSLCGTGLCQRRLSRSRIAGLSPGELGIVFIMSLVGASIPTWGTSTYMIAVIAAPKFFASPENQWQEKVVQYAKDWLMPRDDIALKWFYNGLPAGESIPWGAWIAPLFWWTSLVVAIFFLCHCLVAALRKQWVEHERLPHALMEYRVSLLNHRPVPTGPALCANPFSGSGLPFFSW